MDKKEQDGLMSDEGLEGLSDESLERMRSADSTGDLIKGLFFITVVGAAIYWLVF